jgi:hypothetical protein
LFIHGGQVNCLCICNLVQIGLLIHCRADFAYKNTQKSAVFQILFNHRIISSLNFYVYLYLLGKLTA